MTDFVLFLFDLGISALVVNVIEFAAAEDRRSAVYMQPDLIRSSVYLRRHTLPSHLSCAVDAVLLCFLFFLMLVIAQ